MKNKTVKSSRVPIYRDSGFLMDDAEEMRKAFLGETDHKRDPDAYIYSRYRNPTVVAAEEEIMKVEGCEWALLTQSGMAAIDTVVSLFQNGNHTRPWLFFTEIYGGTISFIESVLLKRRGIEAEWFAPADGRYDLKSLEKKLATLKPDFVYFETISNPMLIVADGPAIISLCKKMGVKTIVDNTFATPYLWKPLDIGADLVIHSATKYFSGHGNLTAGVVCGNDDKLLQAAIAYRKLVGHMISPDDAYRLHTQVQTFGLRFQRQCENALKLAEYLYTNNNVRSVFYPGLESHITHSTASELFGNRGYGAMVTFSFAGNSDDVKRKRRDDFIGMIGHKIRLIPTLGDPHTILMPVEPVWGHKYPDPGMIRVSVGFEHYSELIGTFMTALDSVS